MAHHRLRSRRRLLEEDPALSDLEVAQASLEEAFLALTTAGDDRRESAEAVRGAA